MTYRAPTLEAFVHACAHPLYAWTHWPMLWITTEVERDCPIIVALLPPWYGKAYTQWDTDVTLYAVRPLHVVLRFWRWGWERRYVLHRLALRIGAARKPYEGCYYRELQWWPQREDACP